jgi:hypothetical protein
MINIICYTGGCCGDLLTALIDSQNVDCAQSAITIIPERSKLKKPHLFTNDIEKDQYIIEASSKWKSIPSHDLTYHINRRHNFIGITVKDKSMAIWAAERFKQLHSPHVWKEMQAACGVSTVKDYAQMLLDFSNLIERHTNKIVSLESIIDGTVIRQLKKHVKNLPADSQDLYENWLELQKNIPT